MAWFKFGRKDPFDEFRREVARAFAFLVSDLQFVDSGETSSHRDIEIAFSRAPVRVVIGYELESDPWVYIDLQMPNGRQELGLHLVIEDRLGTQTPLEDVASATSLSSKLQVLADLTSRHARHLLTGDTSSVAKLRALRAAQAREQNRQMFGTSTGETPRFSERPTLPQLFADATNDDVRSARAYQAVWDYNYATSDVAAFLRLSNDAVEELLQRWESAI